MNHLSEITAAAGILAFAIFLGLKAEWSPRAWALFAATLLAGAGLAFVLVGTVALRGPIAAWLGASAFTLGRLTIAVSLLLLFCLPSGIAFSRRHRHRQAILALNLLLGLTIIGWIISLIWSLMDQSSSSSSSSSSISRA